MIAERALAPDEAAGLPGADRFEYVTGRHFASVYVQGDGRSVERIGENCEPALCTVLFMGGAGGSLRAGVTENPIGLTRSVQRALTRVTSGGAPVYIWPGGGITMMVDVESMPDNAFGYVPTPALVAPIEFSMRKMSSQGTWPWPVGRRA